MHFGDQVACCLVGDPAKHTAREQATVGALRALAQDVDTTRIGREEWKKRNEAIGIGVF